MFTEHHPTLARLLDDIRPKTILVVDPHAEPLPSAAGTEGARITHVRADPMSAVEGLERFDFGVVANTLERLDAKAAGALLAGLRDLHSGRFVALAPIGAGWQGMASVWEENDLLAFGMTLMARYQVAQGPLALYHFNLADYKTTPDWLNSRYWAHPERWEP
ncbi:hypothetical protein HUS23_13740 [Ectothiorhodospiraceae bacterium 2226]|nr:hypothetical protein HUS23_13740 [Ectothiorhodospiraceae bacterium 2226]